MISQLKYIYIHPSLEDVWMKVSGEEELLNEKNILKVILPFPFTFLFDSRFSVLSATKAKY